MAKLCPQKNICRMCIHAQRVSDMEEQMSSVLHSRDQLETLNDQNKLLQEQVALLQKQVNQAQAPGTPKVSSQVERGTRGVVSGGILGIHLWPTLPTRGTHNAASLDHPQTSQSTTTSGTQPQTSPRTVVISQPPTVVRAEGPTASVRPKQPILPGRPASNSSSNPGNNKFATNGRPQPLLPTPHNRPTTYPRPPVNLTSSAAQSQRFDMPLTNRFLSLQEQHSDTPTDRKSTRLNSSHSAKSRMPSSA